jgi:hypothetical protein
LAPDNQRAQPMIYARTVGPITERRRALSDNRISAGRPASTEENAMISLILVVCLAGSPSVCREETPPVEVDSPMVCMIQGQQIAVEWLDEHPKWSLRSWRCRFGAPEKGA